MRAAAAVPYRDASPTREPDQRSFHTDWPHDLTAYVPDGCLPQQRRPHRVAILQRVEVHAGVVDLPRRRGSGRLPRTCALPILNVRLLAATRSHDAVSKQFLGPLHRT